MPRNRWFRRGRPGVHGRVVEALAQARAGDPDGALATIFERFPEALAMLEELEEPHDSGWLQLAARLAFRSGDMPQAADLAERAITGTEDASTWNLLGRIRVWLKRPDAATAFRNAASLAPDEYVMPYRVSHDRFARLADAALRDIPDEFQAQLTNTLVVVDDLPDLDSVKEGEDPDLLGLYEGATVLEHGLPERIVLYQRNIENICADERDLIREVEETMRHEVGHHFGMTEDDLPY